MNEKVSPETELKPETGEGETHHLELSGASRGDEYRQGVLYKEVRPTGEKRYELRKQIGGLNYIFVLYEHWDRIYKIKFKTEEYDYALTGGSEEDVGEVFSTLRQIVDTARKDSPEITRISIEPATHAYGVEEIEACKTELLSKNPTITRQSLDELEGFEVLRKYQDEGLGDFPLSREREKPGRKRQIRPHELRGRLFRIYFRKYFPEWKIEQDPWGSSDFMLVLPDEHDQ